MNKIESWEDFCSSYYRPFDSAEIEIPILFKTSFIFAPGIKPIYFSSPVWFSITKENKRKHNNELTYYVFEIFKNTNTGEKKMFERFEHVFFYRGITNFVKKMSEKAEKYIRTPSHLLEDEELKTKSYILSTVNIIDSDVFPEHNSEIREFMGKIIKSENGLFAEFRINGRDKSLAIENPYNLQIDSEEHFYTAQETENGEFILIKVDSEEDDE